MNNLDKYFRTQAQLDRQFRKLTSNPIADFIAQQQALYDNFGTSATSAIAFQQNLDKKFTLYANTLPAGFKYPENPLHDLVNSYYKIYGAAVYCGLYYVPYLAGDFIYWILDLYRTSLLSLDLQSALFLPGKL